MKSLSASTPSQLCSWQLEHQTSAPAPKEQKTHLAGTASTLGRRKSALGLMQMENVLKYTDS